MGTPIPTLPNVIRGMNCLGAPVWSRVSEWNGSGPFGLAPMPSPFPDSQRIFGCLPPTVPTSVG